MCNFEIFFPPVIHQLEAIQVGGGGGGETIMFSTFFVFAYFFLCVCVCLSMYALKLFETVGSVLELLHNTPINNKDFLTNEIVSKSEGLYL